MRRSGAILVWLIFLFAGYASAQDDTNLPDHTLITITDERLDAALSAFERDRELQKERPERAPEPLPPLPERRSRSTNSFAEFFANLFRALGPIIFWTLAAAFLGLILWAIYLMFGESLTLRRKEKQAGTEKGFSIAPDLMPDETAARALLGDAEALAAQGQFAEAVHALLFRSIDLIQARQPRDVKNSLTAREIGKLSVLPDLIRNGLSPIIVIVERSYFGGQAVDETGWIEARDAYRSFALGEAGA